MSDIAKRGLRAVRQWLRLVQPRPAILILLLAMSVSCDVFYLSVGWWFGAWPDARPFFLPRDVLLAMGSFWMGIHRVIVKHPALDQQHYLWLMQMPWVRGKPLPRGPVHLVIQDVLLLGLLLLLGVHHQVLPWVSVPFAFLSGYLIALAKALWQTGTAAAAFYTLLVLGMAVHCLSWLPEAALIVGVIAYCLAISAYWQSLLRFPWLREITMAMQSANRQSRAFQFPPAATVEAEVLTALAELPMIWPFGLLHHRHDPHTVSRFEAWAIGILVGWWTWAVLSIFPNPPQEIGLGIVALFVCGCILIRLHRYRAGYASPLSISGRLATRQWIIPGYDRVFLAPLAVFVANATLTPLLWSLQTPTAPATGGLVSLIMLITLLAPPSLRNWQLTAPARLKPIAVKAPQAAVEEI